MAMVFFLFILFLFNKIVDDSSFVYSNSRYFYRNLKDVPMLFNFILSFFVFCFFLTIIFSLTFLMLKIFNYFTGNFLYLVYKEIINFLKLIYLKIPISGLHLENKYFFIVFFFYFTVCVFIYLFFFNSFFVTFREKKKKSFVNTDFFDFGILKLNFLKILKKKNQKNVENNLFYSINQISFFKAVNLRKKKNKKKK